MTKIALFPNFLLDLVSEKSNVVSSDHFMREGRRNNDLTRMAGSVRRISGLDEEGLSRVLLTINQTSGNPLPENEVRGIARSVAKYEANPIDLIDDVHLSKALAEELRDEFRFCAGAGWMRYSLGQWKSDTGGKHVQERVKTFVAALYEGMKLRGLAADSDRVKAISAYLKAPKINNLITLATSDPALLVEETVFDAKSGLLNLRNGTIEFATGKIVFREHRAEDYLTKIADVTYDPEATAPLFDKLLAEALEPELGAFVMRFFGYVATGQADQRVYSIFYGKGANGKSTVVNIIQRVLGDYCANVEPATFLQARSGQVRGDIARLKGIRMAVSSEFGIGQVMDAPLVKQLVGGDAITARRLYQSEFEFTPTVVPVFVTNALPVINGADEALAARTIVVPFTNIIPPEARDPMLPFRLWEERTGILNVLLAGVQDYLCDRKLRIPKPVKDAVDAYIKSSDLLAQFLEDCCGIGPSGTVGAQDLYNAYRYWCIEHGVKSLTQPVFKGELLKKDGMRQGRTSEGMRWTGVTLKA
ncbi:putative DNA primase/helicase [Sulfitobacter brevis]|uniref:Putative DNA primase/helicase n=1 Tax=Sulfitobacter brevis TaxID=74348 RepID=A0A1I1ULW4_9RHOB|nr:phage/plasmid primase, P4 family [Sulfitobacter brevis]SFD69743.1 putative DNA primase/helicase [Sulfitobacter brevis]